jgi:UDP-N-acetylmuramoyl-L-alanyl-D-glutamate--2,6-diaminopimelate ligase
MIRSLKWLYHLIIASFATIWFGFPATKLTVVGVTGTDGKTTTTTLIYEILKAAGYKTSMITSVHAVIAGKTYDTGFHVTTPNAWFVQKYLAEALAHGDTHMVLEVTSHGLAQHRVFGIPFAAGVITNVTHEHLDWHKTFAQYMDTKISLLEKSNVAVINQDEDALYARAMSKIVDKRAITYGIRTNADITPKTCPFSTKLIGEFNTYNCLAAAAVAVSLGVPRKVIGSAISRFSGVSGRMETLYTKPFTVIVDFAHTPNAIEKVLSTVRKTTKGRLIHVFGSAGLRDHTKRPFMGEASSRYADIIVLTEEDYRSENVETITDEIQKGIAKDREVHRILNRAEAIKYAVTSARRGDTVIITGKGHERSLCRGQREHPWSDQKEVRKWVQ